MQDQTTEQKDKQIPMFHRINRYEYPWKLILLREMDTPFTFEQE
jgi:hypothetical protein